MHGRLKLRAPDAARRRQREEKLQLLRDNMAALARKRSRGELDGEVLSLTAAVLGANPDISTCWNLRRLVLPSQTDWVEAELSLVAGCLGVNPKSYGAWHHRGWVLGRAPHPRPEETRLCERLLAADPRNFHAWEHRRLLGGDPETELVYTGKLLGQDFSNFSAWHHRARLLLAGGAGSADAGTGSDETGSDTGSSETGSGAGRRKTGSGDPGTGSGETGSDSGSAESGRGETGSGAGRRKTGSGAAARGVAGVVTPERLREELSLAHSAVFTDPSDQSPWVYLRCLLAKATPPPRLLALHLTRRALSVTFSRPLKVGEGLQLSLDGAPPLAGPWRAGEGRPRPSHTWVYDLPPAPPPTQPLVCRVTWEPDPAPRQLTLLPDQDEAWYQEPIRARELFWPEVGVAAPELLQEELEICRELLQLEPKSRGCLLTLLLLLTALDPLGHAREIRDCLQRLKEADPLRGGFVGDVASRAELTLAALGVGEGPEGEIRLRIQGKSLTSLPLLEHLTHLTHLELPNNLLRGVPPTLGGLRRLRLLDLSHNQLSSLETFPPLPRLQELRLDGNPIGQPEALSSLAACPRLARLGLVGTPLAAAPEAEASLARALPGVSVALS